VSRLVAAASAQCLEGEKGGSLRVLCFFARKRQTEKVEGGKRLRATREKEQQRTGVFYDPIGARVSVG
jgi:hypothetical protein